MWTHINKANKSPLWLKEQQITIAAPISIFFQMQMIYIPIF